VILYRVRCYALASLVGLALLACSAAATTGWVSFDPRHLCDSGESENCFETELGFVRGGNGSNTMEVSPIVGDPETVAAYDAWNETPAPGTHVNLERWEGDEIAFVSVPSNGSRYKTSGAPDRETPVFIAVILAVMAVVLPVKIVREAS
jgi:hypothetical protein